MTRTNASMVSHEREKNDKRTDRCINITVCKYRAEEESKWQKNNWIYQHGDTSILTT